MIKLVASMVDLFSNSVNKSAVVKDFFGSVMQVRWQPWKERLFHSFYGLLGRAGRGRHKGDVAVARSGSLFI